MVNQIIGVETKNVQRCTEVENGMIIGVVAGMDPVMYAKKSSAPKIKNPENVK